MKTESDPSKEWMMRRGSKSKDCPMLVKFSYVVWLADAKLSYLSKTFPENDYEPLLCSTSIISCQWVSFYHGVKISDITSPMQKVSFIFIPPYPLLVKTRTNLPGWRIPSFFIILPSKRNPSDLAEGEVYLSDGVVPGEAVVVEDVQVQHPRLQLVDREA